MDSLKEHLDVIGFNQEEKLNLKELKKFFKRKSIAMLPEKHPTVPNAHSRFEALNFAFVEVRQNFLFYN